MIAYGKTNMDSDRSKKFQWISIVYLMLFVLAVFSPSIIKQGYFGIHEQHIEEMLIFLFGLAGISIFMFYERLMERKEKEQEQISHVYDRAKRELISSYQYIGALNRQMEVLKKLTNDTSVSIFEQDALSKDLLQSLISSAAASLGGVPATLRFVNLPKLRTEHEVSYSPGKSKNSNYSSISNKELKNLNDQKLPYSEIGENDKRWIAVPSDRTSGDTKAFIILKRPHEPGVEEFDPSIMRVFANQAELIYRAMCKKDLADNGKPMDLIEIAMQGVEGEVN